MRLVMMGTGPFAVPSLHALFEHRHEVIAVVTRPPQASRGRRSAETSPMATAAAARGTPVWSPQSANSDALRSQLVEARPELLVVCDYGEIISNKTLETAPLGGVNLHGSLLPKYRGAAPVAWAIYHGERETGLSVIQMTAVLDAGPCIAQHHVPIEPDETAAQLEARLAALGGTLLCRAIDDIAAGQIRPVKQDPTQATKAPKLTKADGLVDWRQSGEQIKNQVRAMQPWPTTYTFWKRANHDAMRLILQRVAVRSGDPGAEPGSILSAGPSIVVACGRGSLEVLELQAAGKRVMEAAEFLRGNALQPGSVLGARNCAG